MIEIRDPRINGELGWKAIHNRVKQIKRDRDLVENGRTRPKDELFDLRMAASLNVDFEKISKMKVLGEEVCRHERRSACLWCI